ncbi:MAG: hypothetical protein D6730_18020 [Bacteroidetes bacterium]|nr:MAG: hypothetical protein D6730_18020 [Bacteroidota bacterium]
MKRFIACLLACLPLLYGVYAQSVAPGLSPSQAVPASPKAETDEWIRTLKTEYAAQLEEGELLYIRSLWLKQQLQDCVQAMQAHILQRESLRLEAALLEETESRAAENALETALAEQQTRLKRYAHELDECLLELEAWHDRLAEYESLLQLLQP